MRIPNLFSVRYIAPALIGILSLWTGLAYAVELFIYPIPQRDVENEPLRTSNTAFQNESRNFGARSGTAVVPLPPTDIAQGEGNYQAGFHSINEQHDTVPNADYGSPNGTHDVSAGDILTGTYRDIAL